MGIENLAKGVFSQTVTPALKKVAGQIGGIIGSDIGRDSRDAVGRNPSVEETKNLCFPKDLLTDNFAEGNHGHYIQFFINHQDKAKLTFGERVKPNLNDEVNNRSISSLQKDFKEIDGLIFEKKKEQLRNKLNNANFSYGVSRGATKDLTEFGLIDRILNQKKPRISLRHLIKKSDY